MNPQSPELKRNLPKKDQNLEKQKVSENEKYVQSYDKKTKILEYVQQNINKPEIVTKSTLNDLENQFNKNLPRMNSVLEDLQNKLSDPSLSQEVKDSIQKRIEGLNNMKNKSQEIMILKEKQNKDQEIENPNSSTKQEAETAIKTSSTELNQQKVESSGVENLEGYNQIVDVILQTKKELSDVVKNLSAENLDPKVKIELELKVKELIEKIKQLQNKLESQGENINEENLSRAKEITTEITDLESQPDSEDKQRQINELKSKYQNLVIETDQVLDNYKNLLNQSNSSSFDTSNQKLNVDLVKDINDTLSKLDTSLGEKFKRIESNNRVNSLS